MDKRQEKKQQIIKQAKEIFLTKGLFNTVMDDIANKAGMTRRTIYRYFETKEDLAYETTILLLSEWNDFHENIYAKLTGSGLMQLSSFLYQSIDFMEARIDIMKYLGEFDFYFTQEESEQPSSDSITRFNSIILKSDDILTILIEKGIKDGSIKKGMDAKLLVATISNVLWSFGQRIAVRGDMIKAEYDISGINLIKHQVALYMMAIKAEK